MAKIQGIILGGIMLVLSASLGSMIYTGVNFQNKKDNLVKKAIEISAGDDRIWQDGEKRNFLKELGIGTVVQNNNNITYNTHRAIDSVDFYESERHIGRVSLKDLESYVNRHTKK